MSIHNDPRRYSTDEEEVRAWENDMRMEYAKQEYYDSLAYEEDFECDYVGEDGSCNYDGHCVNQTGKWKDTCALWKEKEDADSD